MSKAVTREGYRSICDQFSKNRGIFHALVCLAVLALCAFAASSSALAQVSVLTAHNDIGRTGQNTNETILNTSNVKLGSFGRVFTLPVTGQIYAQPLYVPNVTINGTVHNLIIVATEADLVYAFDADTPGTALWMASMVDSTHGAGTGEGPLNESATIGCTDMQPQIGITATPVIDSATQTIYVEAKSAVNTNQSYIHRLHALSLLTGAEKAPGPVVISATVSGMGDGSKNNVLPFDNLHQMARPGLLELNGAIYIAYASHCDYGPYHGWVFAYDTATFTQKSLFITDPNGGLGGFWMGGAGIAADQNFNIFLASGNGDFSNTSTPTEYGDSIIKLSTTNSILSATDYFTPSNQSCLDTADTDLGSGGVMLLPNQTGTFPHILVQSGKQGRIYVVNRDAPMTTTPAHYNSVANCQVLDPEIIEASNAGAIGGIWGAPAYWNNSIYYWGNGDVLKSIPVTNGLPDFTNVTMGNVRIGFPGPTPSISSNGTTSGTAIVWAIDAHNYGSPGPGPGPAVLHALDATAVGVELWNSAQDTSGNDTAGNAVKFTVPTIANGKVYIGTSTEVDVYGLKSTTSPPATPVITPGTETVSTPVHVSITDATSGASIYYTTNGSTPTTSSTLYTRPFPISSTSTVQSIAALNGVASGIASVTYTFGAAVAVPTFSPASGTFTGSLTVSISDATSGALIYYTTDGTTPVAGQGTTQQYSNPLTFTKSTQLKAIAVSGAQSSKVAAGAYRVQPGA
jgi:Chitobiase/beta-hexosaminidase C-terminal domain